MKPKNIDECDALAYTADMWQWLSENPLLDKHDYPSFRKGYNSDCMLCAYYLDQQCGTCADCPISKLPGGDCYNPTSVFHRYYESRDANIRAQAAKEIADCAKSAYFKYTPQ